MSDVVLVSMPFGSAFSPSLGLSLLKAGLAREGISASVQYFTLPFARRIGQAFYTGVADEGIPALQDLPGEWIFSGALWDEDASEEQGYVDALLRGYYSEAVIARVLRARRGVNSFLQDCLAAILREKPRLVGFTSIFQQHVASLALARQLKRACPDVIVVFGGSNCEGVMGAETIRSFPFVDAAVSGEADLVFPELVRRALNGGSLACLPGVRARDAVDAEFAAGRFSDSPMVADLDGLPCPDFSDFFDQFRATPFDRAWHPTIYVETARGCWWGERMHCTFCGLNGATMGFRSKTAARALAEFDAVARRYPGCDIRPVDNILDLRYFKDLIPALATRRQKRVVFWETKSNLTKPQLRLLRDAGVRELQPGIENLSDTVLKLMRKGVSGLQNVQLLKWCEELGLDPRWNFLWGFPGEPIDEYTRLAGVIPALTHLPPPGCAATIRLDRFSPNYYDAERLGFARVEPFEAYGHIYRLSDGAIANLACYFRYDYREPRDVDGYVAPLARRIAAWKRQKPRAALLTADAGGHLVVIDLRPPARTPFTVLSGLARRLYEECDGVRDLWQLTQVALAMGETLPAEAIEQMLAPLVERRLLLRDGRRYLALAIPLAGYAPSSRVSHEFARAVRSHGQPDAGGWVASTIRFGGTGNGAVLTTQACRAASKGQARVPHLSRCGFSVDARGRLVIQASARPRPRRRSH